MFGKRSDVMTVIAEHGRWIARIRDDAGVLEQRSKGLERRVSTLEQHLAKLDEFCRKLDPALASLRDELARLSSRVDALAGVRGPAGSRRRRK